jgi:hypothetical protein
MYFILLMIVKNEKLEIYDLEFLEFNITDWSEYEFLKNNIQNYFIFGDAIGKMLVTLMNSKNLSNFPVYILDDEFKSGADGPFPLSEILDGMEIDDREYFLKNSQFSTQDDVHKIKHSQL